MSVADLRLVTVCNYCLRASCWQSWHPCEWYYTAVTTTRTVDELRALEYEHESYWAEERVGRVEGV